MRFKNLVDGLARRRGGAWFLGGIAAVLIGVERLMAVPNKGRSEPSHCSPVAGSECRATPRTDFFSIKQTKSDLGYSYWVLQGHGAYASFELFDTWAEAIAGAHTHLSGSHLILAETR